jgi:DNA-binding response OmpR family regulator
LPVHVIKDVAPEVGNSSAGEVVVVRAGELELWGGERQAWAAGMRINFSPREFELLFALAVRERHVVTRANLYELVWNRPMKAGSRDIDVYVRKVRNKLRAASPGWQYLHTHHALGYRFEAERSATSRP